MSKNTNLNQAKTEKNPEFYTLYKDVEVEMNAYISHDKNVFKNKTILCPCDDPEWSNFTRYFAANFERLGIKKLISTSYARSASNKQISLFEQESEQFDKQKHETHGKIFVAERGKYEGHMNEGNLKWQYLEGDGDFRSDEVTALRNEADMIITNPPFHLFREFIAWIMEGDKKFSVIGNMNSITCKEIFPLIKSDEIWLGTTSPKVFIQPDGKEKKFGNICWYTNLEHGVRHEPLQLMTMKQNLKYNKKLIKILTKSYCKVEYPHYDNYDALEVPYSDAIPSDYDGVVGVPISFLYKYCPEQFEIVGASEQCGKGFSNGIWRSDSKVSHPTINKQKVYSRILIKRK